MAGNAIAPRAGRRASSSRAGHGVLIAVAALVTIAGCSRNDVEPVQERSDALGSPEPQALHQAFTLDESTLLALLADAPDATIEAVLDDPIGFLEQIDVVLELPYDQTVLVDKDHPLPEGYEPEELVELDSLSRELVLSRPGHRLTPAATEALIEMTRAAQDEGITLVVSSTYRSYEYQRDLFARWVTELGEDRASLVSARPGTSQHQLGTAVDFGCICDEFARQPAGIWLAKNAGRFGFSLSYPEGLTDVTGYAYEPWHFRYTGLAATRLESDFFGDVQQHMLEFLNDRRAALEDTRVSPPTE